MRMLSEQEMDLLLGGDDSYTQTMNTISVTGYTIRASGGDYIALSPGFIREESSGCSWCAQYYAGLYAVVPLHQVPSKQKVTCLANATAPPGKAWRAGFTLNIMNSRGYRNPSVLISQGGIVHRGGAGANSSGVSGYTQEVGGVTIPHANGTSGYVYLYGAGMLSGPAPANYIDPITMAPGSMSGTLTAAEHIVYTIVHELYHTWNPLSEDASLELYANGWGAYAVMRYRQGAGANC